VKFLTTKESDEIDSNVRRVISCMELFKALNILPVLCMYIMEIVYNVKLNRLEQNLDRHYFNTRERHGL